MKRMSFALTTAAMHAGAKTVTRRRVDSWTDLKPGDRVIAVEKAQGLPKGSKQAVIGEIEIVDVRVEQLDAITPEDVIAEGFPDSSPDEFVNMFLGKLPFANRDETIPIRRIEFRHVGRA